MGLFVSIGMHLDAYFNGANSWRRTVQCSYASECFECEWVREREWERARECVLVYVLKVAGNWDCCACEYINALAICGGISAISLWSHLLRARVCFDFFFFLDYFFSSFSSCYYCGYCLRCTRTCSVRCTSCCFTLSLYYLLKSLHTVFFLQFSLSSALCKRTFSASILSFIAFWIYRCTVFFFKSLAISLF